MGTGPHDRHQFLLVARAGYDDHRNVELAIVQDVQHAEGAELKEVMVGDDDIPGASR